MSEVGGFIAKLSACLGMYLTENLPAQLALLSS
jgi:hypothetical protein